MNEWELSDIFEISLVYLPERIMQKNKPLEFKAVSQAVATCIPETVVMRVRTQDIAEFCQRWKIQKFYLFGSVLRDDFRPDSDVDVMVTFAPDAQWGFEFVDMKQELEKLFDRKVDLLTRNSIEQSENWIRREEILGTAKLIYVQG